MNDSIKKKVTMLLVFSVLMCAETVFCAQQSDVTIVVNKTQTEELTPDRMFDLAFLTSRTLYHTLESVKYLKKGDQDNAQKSLNIAIGVVGMLEKLIPEVTVDMTITDEKGKKIGDHQVVRINEIPIFQWMTNVKVVVPVVTYRNRLLKKENLPQVNVAPENQLWVDVDYLAQALREASPLLKNEDGTQAIETLDDALLSCIRVSISPYDKDLKPVIHSLLQAYWQCETKQYEKAGKSISKAKKNLQRYAKKEDLNDDPEIKELISDLAEMESSVSAINSDKIKQCWFKIVRKKFPEL